MWYQNHSRFYTKSPSKPLKLNESHNFNLFWQEWIECENVWTGALKIKLCFSCFVTVPNQSLFLQLLVFLFPFDLCLWIWCRFFLGGGVHDDSFVCLLWSAHEDCRVHKYACKWSVTTFHIGWRCITLYVQQAHQGCKFFKSGVLVHIWGFL